MDKQFCHCFKKPQFPPKEISIPTRRLFCCFGKQFPPNRQTKLPYVISASNWAGGLKQGPESELDHKPNLLSGDDSPSSPLRTLFLFLPLARISLLPDPRTHPDIMSLPTIATSQPMPGLDAVHSAHHQGIVEALVGNRGSPGGSEGHAAMLDEWAEEPEVVCSGGPRPFTAEEAAAILTNALTDDDAGNSDGAPVASALDAPQAMDLTAEAPRSPASSNSSVLEEEASTFGPSASKVYTGLRQALPNISITDEESRTYVNEIFKTPAKTAQLRTNLLHQRISNTAINREITKAMGLPYTPSGTEIVIGDMDKLVARLKQVSGIARSRAGNRNGQPKQKRAYDLSTAKDTTGLVLQAGLPCVLGNTNSGENVMGFVGFEPCIRTVPNGPKGDELHRQVFYLDDAQRKVVNDAQLAWDDEALFRIDNVFNRPAVRRQQRTALMIVLYESGHVFVKATTYKNYAAKEAMRALVQMVKPHVHVLKPSETYYCSSKPQTDRFAGVLIPTMNTQTDQLQQEAEELASKTTALVGVAFGEIAPLAASAITQGYPPNVVLNGTRALMQLSTGQQLSLMGPEEMMAIVNGNQYQPPPEDSLIAPFINKLAEHLLPVAQGQAELQKAKIDLARAIEHEGATQEMAQEGLNDDGPLAISPDQFSAALAAVATFVYDNGFSTGSTKCTAFNPADLPSGNLITFTTAFNNSNEHVLRALAANPGLESFAIQILSGVAEAIIAKVNKLIKKRLEEEATIRNEELANRARAQAHRMMTRSKSAKRY